MDDEAESSRAAQRHADRDAFATEHHDEDFDDVEGDLYEDPVEQEKFLKERRIDAKRKRVKYLDHLLRELDTLVFLELITLYHLEYDHPLLHITSHEMLIVPAAPSSGSRSAPSSTAASSRPSPK
jgi:hypothetical protein